MVISLILQIAIGLAFDVLGYMLIPKVKPPQPPSTEDLDNPVVATGPVPNLSGTMTIKGLGILWWGDKLARTRSIKSKKK